MISGGSLVIDRKVDPSNPLKYTITDKLDVLGLWSSTTTYDALFEPKDGGTDVTVNAPMGTRLQQRWRVRGKNEGGAEMTEEVEVQVRSLSSQPIYLLTSFVHRRFSSLCHTS